MLRETNPVKMPKFDAIVSNSPFSYHWEPTEALGEDARFNSYVLPLNPPPNTLENCAEP